MLLLLLLLGLLQQQDIELLLLQQVLDLLLVEQDLIVVLNLTNGGLGIGISSSGKRVRRLLLQQGHTLPCLPLRWQEHCLTVLLVGRQHKRCCAQHI